MSELRVVVEPGTAWEGELGLAPSEWSKFHRKSHKTRSTERLGVEREKRVGISPRAEGETCRSCWGQGQRFRSHAKTTTKG